MKTMFTSSNFAHRLLFLLMLVGPMTTFSQIGVGTTTPHPSAMLHISPGTGNNKGLILPKITSGNRMVLDSTQNIAHGLIFFDTDLQKFYYFNQSPKVWRELDHDWVRKDIAGASPVVSTHIYSGVSGNVGIGTGTAFDPTEKLTVVGNVSVGAAAWAQDSNITLTNGGLAVDTWIGINTVTRTGTVEFDVKGEAKISSTLTVGGNATVSGDVTANKFNGLGIMPIGTVLMWTGSINTTTNFDVNGTGVVGTQYEGWQLCNGYGTAPDLRGRFIVGALEDTTNGQIRQAQTSGGYTNAEFNNPDYWVDGLRGGKREVTLTVAQMPSHNHGGQTGTDGNHSHDHQGWVNVDDYTCAGCHDDSEAKARNKNSNDPNDYGGDPAGDHDHSISTSGGDAPFENRPNYYSLYYIIRMQ